MRCTLYQRSDRGLPRRDVLKAAAAFGGSALLSGWPLQSARAGEPRIAALGWACAQTLLAIGVVPVAVPEIQRYARLAVEPAVPASVREIGLRSEPNLELLQRLAPDLIVIDPSLAGATSRLKEIAPVVSFENLKPGARPLETARIVTLALAKRVGKEAECQAYFARFDEAMKRYRDEVRGYDGAPLYLISEIVRNRALVFGHTSLYQDVLNDFGLTNAWTGESSIFGHATVGIDVLAAVPQARCVLLTSRLTSTEALFAFRPIMRSLPFLREGRLTVLSEVLFYGGIPAAERFARLLAERLPKVKREQG